MYILFLFFLFIRIPIFASLYEFNTVELWPEDPLFTRVLSAAEEDNFLANRPIIISLGDSCQPALNLTFSKLRFMAYPFDWLVAGFDDVYNMIETDFYYCKQPKYFVQAYDHEVNYVRITHTYYPKLQFPHAHWDTLFEDFNRRINRFYKAIHYCVAAHKKIFFIIHSTTFKDNAVKENANKLGALITYKFPALDFTLIVMHHAAALGSFSDGRYIFKYLNHAGWTQVSYSEWTRVFTAMGLINPYAQVDSFAEHPFQ